MWLLLQYHAKSCKEKVCPVPKCAQIREALRYVYGSVHVFVGLCLWC